LNGSAEVDELLGSVDTRTFDGDLVFHLEDKQVQVGEEFTVDFKAKDFNNTLGYQFTLGFDNNKVEFVDLATNLTKMDTDNFGLTMLEEGIITTSWNTHEAVDVANDETVFSLTETVFSLTFTATEAITVSEILNINSRYTIAEAYNGSDLYDVAITFDGLVVSNDFKLYQNIPNPFTEAIYGSDNDWF